MNVILPRRPMTEDEFLAWVEPLEERWEFDGRGPVPMVGNTLRHGILQTRLASRLLELLEGGPYVAVTGETFARVAGRLRLPDVTVLSTETDPMTRVIAEPAAVFEILSESTARVDRLVKANEYWATPSIRHYVMLEQDSVGAVVLSRGPESWSRVALADDGTIELPAIGVRLTLADVYRGVLFPVVGKETGS